MPHSLILADYPKYADVWGSGQNIWHAFALLKQ